MFGCAALKKCFFSCLYAGDLESQELCIVCKFQKAPLILSCMFQVVLLQTGFWLLGVCEFWFFIVFCCYFDVRLVDVLHHSVSISVSVFGPVRKTESDIELWLKEPELRGSEFLWQLCDNKKNVEIFVLDSEWDFFRNIWEFSPLYARRSHVVNKHKV